MQQPGDCRRMELPPAVRASAGQLGVCCSGEEDVDEVSVTDEAPGSCEEIGDEGTPAVGVPGVSAARRLSRLLSQDSVCSSDEEFLFVTLTCADCGDLFPTRKELLLHRQAAHADKRPHQCPSCMATFRHGTTLAQHRSTHTQDQPHACQGCGQRFTRRSHVLAHSRALHPQEHQPKERQPKVRPEHR